MLTDDEMDTQYPNRYRYLLSGRTPAHRRYVYKPGSANEIDAVEELNKLRAEVERLRGDFEEQSAEYETVHGNWETAEARLTRLLEIQRYSRTRTNMEPNSGGAWVLYEDLIRYMAKKPINRICDEQIADGVRHEERQREALIKEARSGD